MPSEHTDVRPFGAQRSRPFQRLRYFPQVSTFYGLLKILCTMAGGSHVVAEALLQVRGAGCLS